MKRFAMVAVLMFVIAGMTGADIRRKQSTTEPVLAAKSNCIGYTIIEFGKGINCKGDTVRLVRVNGIQTAVAD